MGTPPCIHSSSQQPSSPASNRQQPPGPQARFWGLPQWLAQRRDLLGSVRALRQAHGDTTLMRIGRERIVDVFAPDRVRAVLVEQSANLVRWEHGARVMRSVHGDSVAGSEGAAWQRHRSLLQTAFTPQRLAGYTQGLCGAADAGLATALPPHSPSGAVNVQALCERIALRAMLQSLFGASECAAEPDATGPDAATLASLAAAVQTLSRIGMRELMLPYLVPDHWPLPGKLAKRRALAVLRAEVVRHIASHTAAPALAACQPDAPHMLGQLLRHRATETGQALNPREVTSHCLSLLMAGYETTATALSWWALLMAQQPLAAARAAAEVDRLLGTRAPCADDVPQLPFLTATLKECLRLYPPLPMLMARRTTADIVLAGWTLPRGALLRVTPFVLQRDERSFPQPECFQPERFMPQAASAPHGAWMPFGAGPRACVGRQFAMLELALVATRWLQRFAIAAVPGAAAEAPVLQVTLRPGRDLHLVLQRRP